ncbi:MAG: hypothetical protein M3209_13950 [Acidobacteriota bacterium]|nr:hypothetical protein [Acidobacteriota bacterium]
MNAQKIKSLPIIFAALICFFAEPVSGQTAQENQTNIIRNFELNIVQDRITETDFERSTAAELTGENLSIKVGAGVRAERIDVILRGITGNVRFRASLEQIKARLDRLQQTLQKPPR